MQKPDMRSCLALIKPYVPGKPVEEVERELGLTDVVKMASNENPLGPSPLAVEAMREKLNKLNIYPDGNCFYLKEALAEKFTVKAEQLVLGNGSDEILSLLALAYIEPGDEAVTASPSFSEYDYAMRLMGGIPRHVPLVGDNFRYDLDAILDAVNEKTRLVFLCSPNNPTGTIFLKSDLDRFVERLPEKVLLVLDHAYIEYVSEENHSAGLEYIAAGMPVIVLRTFSKIYGLAGLRIGYGISLPEVIADLNRVREPFTVNAMALVAAEAALKDNQHLQHSCDVVSKGREQLKEGLQSMGFEPVPDEANFFFVNIGIDSREAFQGLMKKGVIVRTGDIFGFPSYIRVTYGTEEQNTRFLTAFREVMEVLS